MFGRLFDLSRASARARRRAAGALRPRRRGRPPGTDLLRRDAPPARPRLEPADAPADPVPRRAHDRARSAQPQRDLGDRARARPRGDDAAADDPVPRGGRPARRPDRGDRPRAGDRRRAPATSSRTRSAGRSSRSSWPAPRERDEAQSVLAGVGCGEPEPGERPDRLTLPAPRDGLELIEDAAAALRRAGIDVSDLGLRRPTLDDVFLQLTGAPPSEDGAGRSGPRRAAARTAAGAAESARARRAARRRLPAVHRPSLHGTALGGHRRPRGHRRATCATSSASRSC